MDSGGNSYIRHVDFITAGLILFLAKLCTFCQPALLLVLCGHSRPWLSGISLPGVYGACKASWQCSPLLPWRQNPQLFTSGIAGALGVEHSYYTEVAVWWFRDAQLSLYAFFFFLLQFAVLCHLLCTYFIRWY